MQEFWERPLCRLYPDRNGSLFSLHLSPFTRRNRSEFRFGSRRFKYGGCSCQRHTSNRGFKILLENDPKRHPELFSFDIWSGHYSTLICLGQKTTIVPTAAERGRSLSSWYPIKGAGDRRGPRPVLLLFFPHAFQQITRELDDDGEVRVEAWAGNSGAFQRG